MDADPAADLCTKGKPTKSTVKRPGTPSGLVQLSKSRASDRSRLTERRKSAETGKRRGGVGALAGEADVGELADDGG